MLKIKARLRNRWRLWEINRLKIPVNLIVFLTNRCNSRCPHCFYWKSLNRASEELDIEEIKKIVNGLDGCKSVGLTGGEPTLREDLLEVCSTFLEKVDNLTLISNGLLPEFTYSTLKKISQNPEKKIHLQLSVEGTKDTHEKIRGKGSFDKVIKTIEMVKDLKDVKTILVTTLSKLNMDALDDTISFFSRYNLEHRFNIVRGIDMSLFNLRKDLVNFHNPRDPRALLTLKEIEYIYNRLLGLNRQYNVWSKQNQLVMEYSIKILKGRKRILNCYAGKLEGVLYPNGDVAFCEFMKPFGNIRSFDYDFRKLWASEKAKIYRKFNRDCYCLHSCNLSTSILYDAKVSNLK